MTIKFLKMHENAVVPKLATAGSACVDLVATEINYEPGSNEAVVKLGFGTEIPEGYKACIAPRSSFTKNHWVMQNSPAQIDSDYRGEWMLKFKAIPINVIKRNAYGKSLANTNPYQLLYSAFPYKVGDRVAQMWIEKVVSYEIEEVETLEETDRGEGGFGSTGK
jgi:dUTP pyrophosphatase